MSARTERLPGQSGKTFVITGANAGLGYFASEQLAAAGAHVVLACRNPAKTDAALAAIRGRVPGASVSAVPLDTADLASVRIASAALLELPRIDGLILNAGIVHPPRTREVSPDGHELVFATNYLGHVALTMQVTPVLRRTPGSRVVALGSMISRLLDSSLDDLELEHGYNRWRAYAQSKIAMQVFGFELDRRLRAAGAGGADGVQSLVAHPGYSISGLTPGIRGVNEPSRVSRFADILQGVAAQGKDVGAWPIVRAAVDPAARGGDYYGPRYLTRGVPSLQSPTRTSVNLAVAERLWSRTEAILGAPFAL
ncbi:SDR family NAD(P)-dependent oxidoreductase [Cryobacterium sp. TMT1-21]|uniref:SDR family NAD(P)-dependent oxidoreductase n=1 Tax=Cryobacterium shii TaxID=1259235 RepID=A0AAQ2HFB7_9MICO|nr:MULTISPECIES: SDR family NAD(P)-dependent oxidoreductase [Cryobacterium]TFC46567.1 SDR family NAD(P)-dependent oxidoreductase [Cryobacterium shii]TFC82674.1 SDR family NAD(P)-dependent oxidoreductase [Cryobacterium sp. TmT2-59]TFD12110.1 SDR family NAD(P)-dependent oxidoreductase [Cryobacterium sp. TMT1-21]TFD12282.1 SDR family NAD(P)-dependent oxidoreductase [Cryobacterium sp. TMT4-10]TFD19329.1 SDR family NAD(P)-dependent oxidoreductase [Cryobacterium sp. TMT2-23]